MFFENISDLNSTITMDSLSYMRLSRDFGTFDAWQEDFVACCLSARNGWAITYFDLHMKKYVNTIVWICQDRIGSVRILWDLPGSYRICKDPIGFVRIL